MPLFEFECETCLRRFEALVPAAPFDAPACRHCGMPEARRVYSAPRVKTDATFQAKNGQLGGAQFSSDAVRDHYLAEARKAGVTTDGKYYEGRLGRFPGDPEAWVAGPDDVRRVCEARGWGCDGDVKVAAPERPPAADVPLARDIVEDLVEDRLEAEYGEDFTEVKGRAVERAVESVLEDHSPPPHWGQVADG